MEATRGALAARTALCVQYCARLPPRSAHFAWPAPLELVASQHMLNSDLFAAADAGDATWRASGEYERAFLKQLVRRIEDAIGIVSDAELASLGIERADLVRVSQLRR